LKGARWKAAVEAADLWHAYDANEVAADNKWKGQRFLVTGILQSVSKDFTNDIILDLRSPNQFSPTRAYLNANQSSTAAGLRKRQEVLLTCTCDGLIVGSPVLKDCMIEDTAEAVRDDDE
jgi:hypothetical protein